MTRFKKNIFNLIIASSAWIISTAIAATLPLPANLIAYNSPQGQALFAHSQLKTDFWPLSMQFVTQDNVSFCAVASSVMVLNALAVQAPRDENYAPYRIFTQNNFFTPDVEKIILRNEVRKHGITLDQLGAILKTFHLDVKVVHANETDMQSFRKAAISALTNKNNDIIVNFLRTGMGEQGGGHDSPLAAYDQTSDRFLLLDVARYKYPPVWVKTQDLWRAINTIDDTSKVYRGFVLISKH